MQAIIQYVVSIYEKNLNVMDGMSPSIDQYITEVADIYYKSRLILTHPSLISMIYPKILLVVVAFEGLVLPSGTIRHHRDKQAVIDSMT